MRIRSINEIHSEESELFNVSPHVQKAINCFKEVASKETEDDDYSYLSEYCHPNVMAFQQHYRWVTPDTIEFVDQVPSGALGSIAASGLQGLMAAARLLRISDEKGGRKTNPYLFLAPIEQDKRPT